MIDAIIGAILVFTSMCLAAWLWYAINSISYPDDHHQDLIFDHDWTDIDALARSVHEKK